MAQRGETGRLGSLSVWGLIKESVKVFHSRTKLFVSLTLTLILPMNACGLGYTLIATPTINSIVSGQLQAVYVHDDARTEQAIHKDLSEERFRFFAMTVLWLLVSFTLSLFATSAIVYSVACVYSEKVTSYRKVLSAARHLCKRLAVIVLWALVLMFAYVVVCGACISIIAIALGLLSGGSQALLTVVFYTSMIGVLAGSIYLTFVWRLACVVTVLEEDYGLAAMRKSWSLIKGKRLVAVGLYSIHSAPAFLVGYALERWVLPLMHSVSLLQLPWILLVSCTYLLVLSFWYLLMGLLVQTVFYFACKAHHKQSIDQFKLLYVLDAYSGEEFLPLKGASSIHLPPV